MNNTIYSKTLIHASQPDGPVKVTVTEEVNGYFIWLCSEESTDLIGWRGPGRRDEAIEAGVDAQRFEMATLRGFASGIESHSV